MKSIERRFRKYSKANPGLSDLICFAEAIKNQNFTPGMMRRWFYKLVDNSEYDKKDKRVLLQGLEGLLKKYPGQQYYGRNS